MTKRILGIIAFPFYLISMLVSFPFKVLKIIMDDRKDKKSTYSKTSFKSSDDTELLQIGELLFLKDNSEFKIFFKTFLTDKKRFLLENQQLLADYENFEFEEIEAIEAIYIFGDSKKRVLTTDWRGEENEGEIENFLEVRLHIKSDWRNVSELRKNADKEKQVDGKFIVDLLKYIDKDLNHVNKALIFFDLGWDAYVFTVVDQTSQKTIIKKFGTLFHGTEKLSI